MAFSKEINLFGVPFHTDTRARARPRAGIRTEYRHIAARYARIFSSISRFELLYVNPEEDERESPPGLLSRARDS